jgi:hypothetical protein
LNQVFLADAIDWVGVATGVIGAVVVAPSGFQELYRQLSALVPFQARLWLRRWVLRRKPQHHEASVALTLRPLMFSGSGAVFAKVDDNAPIEEQVPQLARAVTLLTAAVTTLAEEAAERDRQNRERAEQATKALGVDVTRVIESIKAADRAAARFNARGLPLIAMGTLMTGPNGILAENIVLGWIVVALAIALIVYGIWPWRPWRPKDTATTD